MTDLNVANHAILAAMAHRTKLVFNTHDPLRPEPFTCYPKDDAQRDAWLARAAAKGWTRRS